MTASGQHSKWLTRKRLIDRKAQGCRLDSPSVHAWHVAQLPRQLCDLEFETTNSPADYALCADGVIVGVVEGEEALAGAAGGAHLG